MGRVSLEQTDEPMEKVGNYFVRPKPSIELVNSGCTLLDLAIGGGYPLGRIVNIIGDKAVGKSLLAIEACTNFAANYPNGKVFYNEVESAFDPGYAEALGLPLDRVDFIEGCFAVEDVFADLEEKLESLDKDTPAIYILDSLDALSDKAELERGISDSSFGAGKAKKLSELFRRLVQKLENKKMLLIIVSQIRDNIGAMFGEKHTRSGGKALDFYASQILMIHNKGQEKKTRKGVERVIGVNVKVMCKKNKIGLPFRSCEYPILFGFGIDDVSACIEYLKSMKEIDEPTYKEEIKNLAKADSVMYREMQKRLAETVKKHWYQIEEEFIPTRSKY
jgi:recombination protein RecA